MLAVWGFQDKAVQTVITGTYLEQGREFNRNGEYNKELNDRRQ